jgi:hypothetical protein
MEINGLPLHALITHAAVVFGPLAALAGVLYAVVSPWRDKLRWPLLVVVAVAVGSIWTAYLSGQWVKDANPFSGELAELLETHESRAKILRWVASGFGLVTLAAVGWHNRPGPMRVLLALLVGAGAVATGVYVVLTGDAGAQIAWFGVEG